MRMGLLGMGQIPWPYTMADLLLGRPFPPAARETSAVPLSNILDAIGRLTTATYDHALVQVAALKKAKKGRPPSFNRVRLEAAASMWLSWNDTPKTQAKLVTALEDWCQDEGIDLGERTIRNVAAAAIKEHEERRGRG